MKKHILSFGAAAASVFMGAAYADVISVQQSTALNPIGTLVGNAGVYGAAAGIAGVADAFRTTSAQSFAVNSGGIGHYLIIPYFTVQDNQSTAFHITNTDLVNGKAVKIRFRGAGNSDDILDFQVYLSPGDVFGLGLEQAADGRLQIFTPDNSCTIPRFDRVPGSDLADKVNGELGYLQSQLGRLPPVSQVRTSSTLAANTREGYIEIFNMADLVPPGNGSRPTGGNNALVYTGSKHVGSSGVAPCPQAIFDDLASPLLDNTQLVPAQMTALANRFGLDTPTTGLVADWYIINGQQNTSFSGAAIALEARTGGGGTGNAARGNFVLFPQQPDNYNLTSDDANNRTTDPLLRGATIRVGAHADPVVVGIVSASKIAGNGLLSGTPLTASVLTPLMFDFPDMSTPYLSGFTGGIAAATVGSNAEAQIEEISQALAVNGVMNQFVTEGSFETDWVFSMPTRRYSVALDYASNSRVFSTGILGVAGARAFFHSGNTSVQTGADLGVDGRRICVATDGRTVVGREEQRVTSAVSPALSNAITFCGETTVLTFNNSSVLDSALSTQNIAITPSTIKDGWLDVNTVNNGTTTAGAVRVGLPVVGYAAVKAVNASFAPTRQFGYTWPHKTVAP